MPRSTGAALARIGYAVFDVRDHGLRGCDDAAIFAFARKMNAAILTEDLGFANILQYPLGTHAGIVVARFPNSVSSEAMNRQIVACLTGIAEAELRGNLVLVEPGRVRIKSMSGN